MGVSLYGFSSNVKLALIVFLCCCFFTAEFCLVHILLQRNPNMFFHHFVECVFHFNGYEGHSGQFHQISICLVQKDPSSIRKSSQPDITLTHLYMVIKLYFLFDRSILSAFGIRTENLRLGWFSIMGWIYQFYYSLNEWKVYQTSGLQFHYFKSIACSQFMLVFHFSLQQVSTV